MEPGFNHAVGHFYTGATRRADGLHIECRLRNKPQIFCEDARGGALFVIFRSRTEDGSIHILLGDARILHGLPEGIESQFTNRPFIAPYECSLTNTDNRNFFHQG